LEIHADRHGLAVLHPFAAPDSAVVFFQLGDIRITTGFDAGLGLTFGKAVSASDGSAGIVCTFSVDRSISRLLLGRRSLILSERRAAN
jgi:hypothetical protein